MVSVVEGKEQRGLLHVGVRFASERIYPNREPKIFPSQTSLRLTNTTLFSVFFQNTNMQGAGKDGGMEEGCLLMCSLLKRGHTASGENISKRQRREVGNSGNPQQTPDFAEAVVILGQLSTSPGPESDPEF